jgi:hypothetical protein
MGIGIEEDVVDAVGKYGKVEMFFLQPTLLQGCYCFQLPGFIRNVVFQLFCYRFCESVHNPALPHRRSKKIIQCIVTDQPPVVASKQAAVCF